MYKDYKSKHDRMRPKRRSRFGGETTWTLVLLAVVAGVFYLIN